MTDWLGTIGEDLLGKLVKAGADQQIVLVVAGSIFTGEVVQNAA
ncbi:MAG: hypothetical protein WCJ31_14075 [Planctomycetia bacterium]